MTRPRQVAFGKAEVAAMEQVMAGAAGVTRLRTC